MVNDNDKINPSLTIKESLVDGLQEFEIDVLYSIWGGHPSEVKQ